MDSNISDVKKCPICSAPGDVIGDTLVGVKTVYRVVTWVCWNCRWYHTHADAQKSKVGFLDRWKETV